MDKPLESDWKTFRKLIPTCRERYLTAANQRLSDILLADESTTATENFWKAHEEIEREAKILRDCLDHLSRSRLWLNVTIMYRHQMLSDEELAMFSDEFSERIKRSSEATS